MIGHIIRGAVSGQATPLQLGLGVLLNQQRSVIDQLYNYGITSSYNEVRRFKRQLHRQWHTKEEDYLILTAEMDWCKS